MRKQHAKKLIVLLLFVAVALSSTLFSKALTYSDLRAIDTDMLISESSVEDLNAKIIDLINETQIDYFYGILGSSNVLTQEELAAEADDLYASGEFGVNADGDTIIFLYSVQNDTYVIQYYGSESFGHMIDSYGDYIIETINPHVENADPYSAGLEMGKRIKEVSEVALGGDVAKPESSKTPLEMLENKSQRIFDDADVLSDEDEATLMEHFDKIKQREKIDFVYVLLGEDYPIYEEELKSLADAMYEKGSFGVNDSEDAIMLMFATSTRKYHIISYGSEKFQKNTVKYGEKIENGIIDEVRGGKDNYLEAGKQFATLSAKYGRIGFVGKFLSLLFSWYMPLVGLVVAAILIAVILASHKGTIDVTERTYEKSGTYRVYDREDRFKYRNVTKTKREKKSSSGGGGGGGSSVGSGDY